MSLKLSWICSCRVCLFCVLVYMWKVYVGVMVDAFTVDVIVNVSFCFILSGLVSVMTGLRQFLALHWSFVLEVIVSVGVLCWERVGSPYGKFGQWKGFRLFVCFFGGCVLWCWLG